MKRHKIFLSPWCEFEKGRTSVHPEWMTPAAKKPSVFVGYSDFQYAILLSLSKFNYKTINGTEREREREKGEIERKKYHTKGRR